MLMCTPEPIVSHAAGITTRPATSACTIPATIFSTASQPISMGASRRSSISRCELKLGDQRHRHRLYAGKHHADRHDAGQQHALNSSCIMPLAVSTRPNTKVSSSG